MNTIQMITSMMNTNNFDEIEYEALIKSNSIFLTDLERAALRVLGSGWYVLGSEVKNFEVEFADYLGVKNCIGVANGLDALVLSIDALRLPRNSEILVASNTYIATILAIIRAGHTPVLVEPVLETFNIDAKLLSGAMTKKTKAICITHLFGKPCNMNEIMKFAHEHGLSLIEDCAQAHGAKFNGQTVGTFGSFGCFSFYPTKNLGAFGDAGAVVTNDDEYADRIRCLRNYGSKEKYANTLIGFNSRLDELQAALLRVKLQRLDFITSHKRSLAKIYFENLPDWVELPQLNHLEYDVFHIYGIRCEARDELQKYLARVGVKTEIHYPIPPHKQEALKDFVFGSYPIAEKLHSTELSLPISIGHTSEDVMEVCKRIRSFSG